jgi:hypothetical protein
VIRYLLRRAWAAGAAAHTAVTQWAAAYLAAPTGSDYDRIDQEIELQYRRVPRQRNQ